MPTSQARDLRSELQVSRKQGRNSQRMRSTPKDNYEAFGQLVAARFRALLHSLGDWSPDHSFYSAFTIDSPVKLESESKLFAQAIVHSFKLAGHKHKVGRSDNPLFWNLRHAFVRGDQNGLTSELKYSFQSFLLRHSFSREGAGLRKLADLRSPYDWYPEARMMQRTIHLHVGPTNSGKTYHALKALENANTGVYAGPLRLLAHEIYSRFKAKGKHCALITGEEQRLPEGGLSYISCTVEMTPLGKMVDVAVIDEIQMIADEERGWAWTQAVLGLQAKELHLCGEERTVDLITAMCARMGDRCVVHRYERLNPLWTERQSLRGSFKNLQKGDAVVSFSRVGLHTLKAGIENVTGKRCAIVYGSLPPETRAQQAALFNDPNNDYDYLAASDAIGMGLNLEIKRVVFESAAKFDGMQHRTLSIPEIRQIGGRAGRYRTAVRDMQSLIDDTASNGSDSARTESKKSEAADAELTNSKTLEREIAEHEVAQPGTIHAKTAENEAAENEAAQDEPAESAAARGLVQEPFDVYTTRSDNIGRVTTLEDEDLYRVRNAFRVEAAPILTAGLFPTEELIEMFAAYYPPTTPLSFILLRLRDMAQVSQRYHLCNFSDKLEAADIIQTLPMSLKDRVVFIKAPLSFREPKLREAFRAFAAAQADQRSGALLDFPEVDLEILDIDRDRGSISMPEGEYLSRLEGLHKTITLYLWLSYRFRMTFFSQDLAFHVKALVEEKINEHLGKLTYVQEKRQEYRATIRKRAEKLASKEQMWQFLGDKPKPVETNSQSGGTWTEEGNEEPLAQTPDEVDSAVPAPDVAALNDTGPARDDARP
jgi:superfamily II DNA/RNA helicase